MERLPLLSSIFILCCFESFSAQNSYAILDFEENFASNVNVSGGVLAAFQFEGTATTVQFDNLFIAKSKDINKLNIKVLSIDGKYSAHFSIQFQPSSEQWVKIAIPSKYKEKLVNYKPEEISVYAYQVEVSNKRKKTHLIFPTAWGEPSALQQKFYINSAGDFAKLAYVDINSGKQVIFCNPISLRVKTSFNYECTLPSTAQLKNNFIIFTTTPGAKGKKYKIWKPKK